jgi:16S rRNA processing protein RimM
MSADNFVLLGTISGAHGIRGEVKVRSFTSPPEAITGYALRDKTGTPVSLKKRGIAKQQLICVIEGVTSRNDAEALKGKELGVPRSELPETADDEFYLEDLAGMDVITTDGKAYGIIKGLHNYGAGDIVEIRRDGADDEMHIFTEATFPDIDVAARRVTIAPPEIV